MSRKQLQFNFDTGPESPSSSALPGPPLMADRDHFVQSSICDLNLQVSFVIAIIFFVYPLLVYVWWRRSRHLLTLWYEVPEFEMQHRYESALDSHVRRTQIYLELLDYLIVSDPLHRNEKTILRSQFIAKSCSAPANLGLKSAHLPLADELEPDVESDEHRFTGDDLLDTWADRCWKEVVVEATQRIPHPCPRSNSESETTIVVDRDADRGQDRDEDPDDGYLFSPSCSVSLELMSVEDWHQYAHLASACGVSFTQNELDAFIGRDELEVGGFFTTLLHRLFDHGITMVHLIDSGDCLFFHLRDEMAVEQLLRQLWPDETRNRYDESDFNAGYGGHCFGDWRLLHEGESYLYPLQSLEYERLHSADASSDSTHRTWREWFCGMILHPVSVMLIGIIFIFLCFALFGFLQRTIPWVDWLFRVIYDCLLQPLMFLFPAAFFFILPFHGLIVNRWLIRKFGPRTIERELQRRTRPNPVQWEQALANMRLQMH